MERFVFKVPQPRQGQLGNGLFWFLGLRVADQTPSWPGALSLTVPRGERWDSAACPCF